MTHVVQRGLADRVVLYGQHLQHLLHLTEDLGQGDALRLQLVLDLGVVALLQTPDVCELLVGAALVQIYEYLQHSLRKVPVEEPNHVLHTGAALCSHCDHVAVPKSRAQSSTCHKCDRRTLETALV